MPITDSSPLFKSYREHTKLPSKGAVYTTNSDLARAFVYYLKEVHGRECNSQVDGNISANNFKAVCWNTMTVWTVSSNTSMPTVSMNRFIDDMKKSFDDWKYFQNPNVCRYRNAIKIYKSESNLSGAHGSPDMMSSPPNAERIDIKTTGGEGIKYPSSYNIKFQNTMAGKSLVNKSYVDNSGSITSNNPCAEIVLGKPSHMKIPDQGYVECLGSSDLYLVSNFLVNFGYKFDSKTIPFYIEDDKVFYISWHLRSVNSGIASYCNDEPKRQYSPYNYGEIRKTRPEFIFKVIVNQSEKLNNNQNGETSKNVNSETVDESINRRKRITRNPVSFGGCGRGFEAKHKVRREGSCEIGKRKRSEGDGLRTRRGVKRLVTI